MNKHNLFEASLIKKVGSSYDTRIWIWYSNDPFYLLVSDFNFFLGHIGGTEFAGNYIECEVLDPLATAFETFLAELRNGVDKGNWNDMKYRKILNVS